MVANNEYLTGAIDREAYEQMLGLDVPVYVQYGRWIGGIFLRGTLGSSLLGQRTVEEKIIRRLPVEVNIIDRMQAPSDRYLLGTDQLGPRPAEPRQNVTAGQFRSRRRSRPGAGRSRPKGRR